MRNNKRIKSNIVLERYSVYENMLEFVLDTITSSTKTIIRVLKTSMYLGGSVYHAPTAVFLFGGSKYQMPNVKRMNSVTVLFENIIDWY